MTLKQLYDFVIENYGNRGCWISELADMLGISEGGANHLTYVLGYRRGRAKMVTPYNVFALDKGGCEIQKSL